MDSVSAELGPLSVPDLKPVPILAAPLPKPKVVLLPELVVAPFPEAEPLPLPVPKVALLRGLEEPLSIPDLELVPIFVAPLPKLKAVSILELVVGPLPNLPLSVLIVAQFRELGAMPLPELGLAPFSVVPLLEHEPLTRCKLKAMTLPELEVAPFFEDEPPPLPELQVTLLWELEGMPLPEFDATPFLKEEAVSPPGLEALLFLEVEVIPLALPLSARSLPGLEAHLVPLPPLVFAITRSFFTVLSLFTEEKSL